MWSDIDWTFVPVLIDKSFNEQGFLVLMEGKVANISNLFVIIT